MKLTDTSWAPPVSFSILLPFASNLNVTKENNLNQDQIPLGPGVCGSVSGTEDWASHRLICHCVIDYRRKGSVVLGEVILNFLGCFSLGPQRIQLLWTLGFRSLCGHIFIFCVCSSTGPDNGIRLIY